MVFLGGFFCVVVFWGRGCWLFCFYVMCLVVVVFFVVVCFVVVFVCLFVFLAVVGFCLYWFLFGILFVGVFFCCCSFVYFWF